jgi:hypothetical protein
MPPNPAAEPDVPSPDPARKAGRAMAFALKCLLDKVPGARDVLPHLAALERALAAEGTAVLGQIPLPALRRMGAQLAALPLDLEDRPLRALQVQVQSGARGSAPGSASRHWRAAPVRRWSSRLAWVQMLSRSQSNTGVRSPAPMRASRSGMARRIAANHCAAYIAPSE